MIKRNWPIFLCASLMLAALILSLLFRLVWYSTMGLRVSVSLWGLFLLLTVCLIFGRRRNRKIRM